MTARLTPFTFQPLLVLLIERVDREDVSSRHFPRPGTLTGKSAMKSDAL